METHRTTLSLYCTPTCTIYDETVTVTANFQSSSGSRPERGKLLGLLLRFRWRRGRGSVIAKLLAFGIRHLTVYGDALQSGIM